MVDDRQCKNFAYEVDITRAMDTCLFHNSCTKVKAMIRHCFNQHPILRMRELEAPHQNDCNSGAATDYSRFIQLKQFEYHGRHGTGTALV